MFVTTVCPIKTRVPIRVNLTNKKNMTQLVSVFDLFFKVLNYQCDKNKKVVDEFFEFFCSQICLTLKLT